ncbi:hypothetical protein [Allofustis seminis]|uniref:hypothetical protein n=1 Tax=Allofustis seminis TaxID=166939 RepID=UPI00035F9E46|nr:hypothetical protein [Allofustis seminis]
MGESDTVNVLGARYTIVYNDPKLENNEEMDGYCDFYGKRIGIARIDESGYDFTDLEAYKQKVVRHEVVHAFLFESGLDISSEWGRNEEIVDWIALQLPKIAQVWEQLER